jgi:hypothetical protein
VVVPTKPTANLRVIVVAAAMVVAVAVVVQVIKNLLAIKKERFWGLSFLLHKSEIFFDIKA